MVNILLVEDERILRDAYSILLSAQDGYRLDAVSNGKEALDACKANTYDIILLDLMMPVLDGAGFLEKAKLPQTMPDARVIIMSNLSSGEGLVKALQLGAHRHVVKSDLSPAEVLTVIDEELQS